MNITIARFSSSKALEKNKWIRKIINGENALFANGIYKLKIFCTCHVKMTGK